MTQGIICPECGSSESEVLHTRRLDGCLTRDRQCEWCSTKFKTIEKILPVLDEKGAYATSIESPSLQTPPEC